jgi:hypothetical protein
VDHSRSIDRASGPKANRSGYIAALALALATTPAPTAAKSLSASAVEIEREAATGAAPSLPLPRMPGMTKLSSSAQFDAETNTWKLKAAFRVNAHVPHVLAFYRKALANEELAVEDVAPVSEDEPYVLIGRSERVHAQVGIRTKPHELETRVWLLWRVRG